MVSGCNLRFPSSWGFMSLTRRVSETIDAHELTDAVDIFEMIEVFEASDSIVTAVTNVVCESNDVLSRHVRLR